MISFTPRPLHLLEREAGTHRTGRWVCRTARYTCTSLEKWNITAGNGTRISWSSSQ